MVGPALGRASPWYHAAEASDGYPRGERNDELVSHMRLGPGADVLSGADWRKRPMAENTAIMNSVRNQRRWSC